MKPHYIGLLLSLVISSAHAAPGFKPDDVRSNLQHLARLTGPTASCSDPNSCQGSNKPSQACTAAYDRLFPVGKTDLDFRVFVSYWDTQPEPGARRTDAVIDNLVKNMFVEILMEPCFNGIYACGFTKDASNTDEDTRELAHLSKNIIGPDGKNRSVHLTVESSSVSDSNYENHHARKSEQAIQSKKVSNDYFDSLGTADVVLYTGHARWGTGPGFKAVPSKLSWAWFDQGVFKPSRRKLEKTLRNNPQKPTVMGYFACTSEKYYSHLLEKNAPETGLALTEVATSDPESQSDTLGTLNALLGLQCEDDFKQTLEFNAAEPEAEMIDFFQP